MKELELDAKEVWAWFKVKRERSYRLVVIDADNAQALSDGFAVALRRCYIDDTDLRKHVDRLECDASDVVRSRIPDPGSVMSGDFGEILTFVFQAAEGTPVRVVGPKKWRLKEARTKPAPYSDVVQFLMPDFPAASKKDVILCAEVKAKATVGTSSPIMNAQEGAKDDRKRRLDKTLAWLRDRAHTTDLGATTIALLDRFIKAIDHPPAKRRFRAVAVVDAVLVADELANAPKDNPQDYEVLVILVPQLKKTYTDLYDKVANANPAEMGGPR